VTTERNRVGNRSARSYLRTRTGSRSRPRLSVDPITSSAVEGSTQPSGPATSDTRSPGDGRDLPDSLILGKRPRIGAVSVANRHPYPKERFRPSRVPRGRAVRRMLSKTTKTAASLVEELHVTKRGGRSYQTTTNSTHVVDHQKTHPARSPLYLSLRLSPRVVPTVASAATTRARTARGPPLPWGGRGGPTAPVPSDSEGLPTRKPGPKDRERGSLPNRARPACAFQYSGAVLPGG
jgi:hypothetical protein